MRGRLAGAIAIGLAVMFAPVPPPAHAQQTTSDAEIAFWQSIRDTRNPAELEAYLRAFPNGRFVPLAKIRLKALSSSGPAAGATGQAGPEADTPPADGAPPAASAPAKSPASASTSASPPATAVPAASIAPVPGDTGWVGVEITNLTADLAKRNGLSGTDGARVIRTMTFGPARAAGLRTDDIILAFDGKPVKNVQGFIDIAGSLPAGKQTIIDIVRSGGRARVHLALGGRVQEAMRGVAAGNSEAMVILGHYYSTGRVVAKDKVKALAYYRRATLGGDRAAVVAIFNAAQNAGGDWGPQAAQARSVLQGLAEAGNAEAAYRSAFLILGDTPNFSCNGAGAANQQAVMRWFAQAAGAGHTGAEFQLGRQNHYGLCIGIDLARAEQHYRKAIEGGHLQAMSNLATLLQSGGPGVKKDPAEALSWYRKADEKGVRDAANGIGFAYATGTGAEKNAKEAVRWFTKGAGLGDPVAQYNLGLYHEDGTGGLRKNRQEAIRYYRLAAAQGYENAQNKLKGLRVPVHDPREVQQMLADLGYDPGSVDGKMGRKTRDAMNQFQRDMGLPVSSEITYATVNRLKAERSKRKN